MPSVSRTPWEIQALWNSLTAEEQFTEDIDQFIVKLKKKPPTAEKALYAPTASDASLTRPLAN